MTGMPFSWQQVLANWSKIQCKQSYQHRPRRRCRNAGARQCETACSLACILCRIKSEIIEKYLPRFWRLSRCDWVNTQTMSDVTQFLNGACIQFVIVRHFDGGFFPLLSKYKNFQEKSNLLLECLSNCTTYRSRLKYQTIFRFQWLLRCERLCLCVGIYCCIPLNAIQHEFTIFERVLERKPASQYTDTTTHILIVNSGCAIVARDYGRPELHFGFWVALFGASFEWVKRWRDNFADVFIQFNWQRSGSFETARLCFSIVWTIFAWKLTFSFSSESLLGEVSGQMHCRR